MSIENHKQEYSYLARTTFKGILNLRCKLISITFLSRQLKLNDSVFLLLKFWYLGFEVFILIFGELGYQFPRMPN